MRTIGIDEVGRGCWAGPLVAGAVLLDEPIAGLKDSKKLTKLQRERLNAVVLERAIAHSLGWATSTEIDAIGLTAAVRLAMERALLAIDQPYDEVIIDGNFNFLAQYPKTRMLIKADDLIPAVSAASIIAKVARDNFMAKVAQRYPGYGFAKNVGYGTALHRAGLQQFGVTDLHRRSFRPIQVLL